ncbi:MAG TPA: fibronectin type III domain-containing protein, partial [Nitrosopumilus sp.]|nr:fibronectin type III domain-containing protein [Nitrosopumilus sp.]
MPEITKKLFINHCIIYVEGLLTKLQRYSMRSFIVFLILFIIVFSISFQDASAITSLSSIVNHNEVPSDLEFNSDGTKMYVVEPWDPHNHVHQYNLSTPYDVTTATDSGKTFGMPSGNVIRAIEFNSDGTKMYLGGNTSFLYQYTLTTPYDVTTAGTATTKTMNSSNTWGIDFNSDGTKMFLAYTTGKVDQYSLSTGFNISTATFVKSYTVTHTGANVSDMTLSNDGTNMLILDSNNKKIQRYKLSAAFDVGTATLTGSVVLEDAGLGPFGSTFKPDGTKLFVVDNGNNKIFQYTVNPAWFLSEVAPSQTTISTIIQTGTSTTIDWTAPSNGGSPITDYKVYYSSNSGTTWTQFIDSISTNTDVTITGLDECNTYIFRVVAVNAIGDGTLSTNATPTKSLNTENDYNYLGGATQDFSSQMQFGSGVTFTTNQKFDVEQFFGANQVFSAGNDFAANQKFCGTHSFTNANMKFGASANFNTAQTFGQSADFSAGTQTFTGSNTFGTSNQFA